MFRNQREWLLYQQIDGGGGGAWPGNGQQFSQQQSNGGQQSSGGQQNNGGQVLSDQEIAALRSLVATSGGDKQTLETLFAENQRIKEENRALRQQQIPAGALLLIGEDAQTWKDLRTLGMPLNDIQAALNETQELRSQIAGMQREGQLRSVAQLMGWNPNVLIKLDKIDGKERVYEMRQNEDGQQYVVIREGRNGETKTALDYAQAAWSEFMPALGAAGQQQQQQQDEPSGQPIPMAIGDLGNSRQQQQTQTPPPQVDPLLAAGAPTGNNNQQQQTQAPQAVLTFPANQGNGGRQQTQGTSFVPQQGGGGKASKTLTVRDVAAGYLAKTYSRGDDK